MNGPPADEPGGTFGDWESYDSPCAYCRAEGQCRYRVWESACGGHEDEQHQCQACGKVWWIDGPDA
jgi:hypothetical protein